MQLANCRSRPGSGLVVDFKSHRRLARCRSQLAQQSRSPKDACSRLSRPHCAYRIMLQDTAIRTRDPCHTARKSSRNK